MPRKDEDAAHKHSLRCLPAQRSTTACRHATLLTRRDVARSSLPFIISFPISRLRAKHTLHALARRDCRVLVSRKGGKLFAIHHHICHQHRTEHGVVRRQQLRQLNLTFCRILRALHSMRTSQRIQVCTCNISLPCATFRCPFVSRATADLVKASSWFFVYFVLFFFRLTSIRDFQITLKAPLSCAKEST
jgi:hypothetical protein